jgi:hypothetical protein
VSARETRGPLPSFLADRAAKEGPRCVPIQRKAAFVAQLTCRYSHSSIGRHRRGRCGDRADRGKRNLRQLLRRVRGVEVSDSTVSRVLKRMGWTRKKIGGCERERRVPEGGLAVDGRRGDLRREMPGVWLV